MTTSKVFIDSSFFCELNLYLNKQICVFFARNGYELVEEPRSADIVIINTCGLDFWRESRSLTSLERSRLSDGEQRLVVFGCLTRVNRELADDANLVTVGPTELDTFDCLFMRTISIHQCRSPEVEQVHPDRGKRYHVVISQGCTNNCSYCSRKHAKGAVRSRLPEDVVADVRTGLEAGYTRFVLLADDCSSYGLDLGTDFAELLNSLNAMCPPGVLFDITNAEPQGFISLYPKIDKDVFRSHVAILELPLQSVSQRVLALMNRHYNVEDVLRIVKDIKATAPGVYLETHIILGFPTEAREEFTQSFALKNFFDEITYLFYSERQNTRAEKLGGKVTQCEMLYRTWLVWQQSLAVSNTRINFGYYGLPFRGICETIIRDNCDEYCSVLLIKAKTAGTRRELPRRTLLTARQLLAEGHSVRILDEDIEEDVTALVRELLRQNSRSPVAIVCEDGAVHGHAETLRAQIAQIEGVLAVAVIDEKMSLSPDTEKEAAQFWVGVLERLRTQLYEDTIRYLPFFLVLSYLDSYRKTVDLAVNGNVTGIPGNCPGVGQYKSPARAVREVLNVAAFSGNGIIEIIDSGYCGSRRRAASFLKTLARALQKADLQHFCWSLTIEEKIFFNLSDDERASLSRLGLQVVQFADSGKSIRLAAYAEDECTIAGIQP